MNSFIHIIFGASALIQFVLAKPSVDFKSIENEIDGPWYGQRGGLLPENMFEAKPRKYECTNVNYLMSNLNYLSGIVSSTEMMDSMIDKEQIYKLGASIVMKDKSLIEPIQNVFMAANIYYELTEEALDKGLEILQKMTASIESDTATENYVESKRASSSGEKLRQMCDKVDRTETYLKEFSASIERCKDNFKETVAPQAMEINKGIKNLTMNYNEKNSDLDDIDKAETETDETKTMIMSAIKEIKSNSEKASSELENCIADKAVNCETFLKGIYKEYQSLLE